MNKRLQARINEALLEVRISNRSGNHFKCFRCNVHDSDKHIFAMFNRRLEYRRLGVPVMTEVIFLNKKRCDILLPTTFEIIEILSSETDERFEEKKETYPKVFEIKKVRV